MIVRREVQGLVDNLVALAIREIYDFIERLEGRVQKTEETQSQTRPSPRITEATGLIVSVLAPIGVTSGNGTPEANVAGKVGDLFLRQDGGANTTLYVKESGAGTRTGWVAK